MMNLDFAAQRAAAVEIASHSPFEAASVAINIESTNPILAAEIRKALERRAARPQLSPTLRGVRP